MAKRKELEDETLCPQSKKQKAEQRRSVFVDKSIRSGSEDSAISLVDPKAKASKRVRVKKPTARHTVAESDIEPVDRVDLISNVVRAKFQQVLEFNSKTSLAASSALDRDEEKRHYATVTESAVLAALMRLRSDYQISDPTLASFDDISEVTVRSLMKSMGDNPTVRHIVLDLSRRSALEASIHTKLDGHGMAEFNLLEAELEMLARDLETAVANDLFCHVQTVYDESDSSAESKSEQTTFLDETKEVARNGVCPAPLMEM